MNDEFARRDPHEQLSKSYLTSLEWCEREAWYDMWAKREWMPKEPVAFGSAVDDGLQVIIRALAAGQPLHVAMDEDGKTNLERALDAAAASIAEAGIEVAAVGVQQAIEAFPAQVPVDWTLARVQHEIDIEVDGIGRVNCHPDVILKDDSILDIKTGKRAKPQWAAEQSYRELGFYAFLREQETGRPVPRVGYATWTRTASPRWQVLWAPVTEEMKRKAYVIARDEVRRLEVDARINDGRDEPINAVFPGGPAWPGKCSDCAYNPAFGGPCEIAEKGAAA